MDDNSQPGELSRKRTLTLLKVDQEENNDDERNDNNKTMIFLDHYR